MNSVRLNKSPRITSKSFHINDIKIDNFILPEVKPFTNIKIDSEIKIENKKIDLDLKYNIGDVLVSQYKNSNQTLYINIEKQLQKPIYIEFNLSKEQDVLVDNIIIDTQPNIKANIIIKYQSIDNTNGFHNGLCNVVARKNSNIQVTVLNLLNDNSQNYYAINNKIEENAKLEYIIADFGGAKTITNSYCNLEGKQSVSNINTMYIGKENQLIDLNYIAEAYGEKCNTALNVYGVLQDNSIKNFKGTIDFKTGCKKAIGSETEDCILLSKTAKAKSLPMLLCREEDVQGEHSNSAGKIDEEKLYYVMTRGISETEAKKLIVKAKFNSIIEKIQEDKIKQEIINEIDRRLI